jgi:hypothetical protein
LPFDPSIQFSLIEGYTRNPMTDATMNIGSDNLAQLDYGSTQQRISNFPRKIQDLGHDRPAVRGPCVVITALPNDTQAE